MFKVTNAFPGGNVIVDSVEGDTVRVRPELRDTTGDWFFWAFRVDGAQGRTLSFVFDKKVRVGLYGAAVSHDYEVWSWQRETPDNPGDSFTYTFGADETSVYFAHNMLYRPERLYRFAESRKLALETLCVSRGGRAVPAIKIGSGIRNIVLTARHHACESTGSYVLEGLLAELAENPLEDATVFCVPMMDFDGVYAGDQGKNRAPHDHNRDYVSGAPSIYPEVAAVRSYIDARKIALGIDFHSPYHTGRENDRDFLVVRDWGKWEENRRFSRLLESFRTPGALRYSAEYDVSPRNRSFYTEDMPDFMVYILRRPDCGLAFSAETAYFGLDEMKFSVEGALAYGRTFRAAIEAYLDGEDAK